MKSFHGYVQAGSPAINHVAIWLDHREARVFHLNPDRLDDVTVTAPPSNGHHKHPRGAEGQREHPEDAKRFFHDVARAVEGTEEVLVLGPSTAKLDFIRYVHKHDHALEARIVGIETVDHPTDGQVVAFAKKYFKLADRVT